MLCLKAKCSEEIAARQKEVNRLDMLIVHSPERAAEERERMEEKVCLQIFSLLHLHVYTVFQKRTPLLVAA